MSTPDLDPARPAVSRRSLLRGGVAAGLTALAATGLGSVTKPALAASAVGTGTRRGDHLVLDYRPSQLTGWPTTPGASFSRTLGGHTTSKDFAYGGIPHRISMLPFGQRGASVHPVYEDVPGDTTLNFRKTLEDAFGAHYEFRYVGFRGSREFRVQSYGVFVREPTQTSPETQLGAGLYVVYEPDPRRGDPPASENLQWIQVTTFQGDMDMPPKADNLDRPNPFYPFGGLTSVNGREVFNFIDIPQRAIQLRPGTEDARLNSTFLAEAFLAHDTGTKNAAGKDIVRIFGGIKWGWQVSAL